ncbi:hypothetical protein WR164_09970 [Philodulcilactobacillus myokoensis]|uniref:YggT family protein n=1 Tax=Philodulcilactobacillus myokoensis TaxID=2929573 RepID=A0A9W6ET51_9LACO|nr:YggT family protein [Philodulcilactobacillus myokoensis]GLB47018.1 hypothetical protein WR164_09970 [Philodulcilactobacillus myokoensis]
MLTIIEFARTCIDWLINLYILAIFVHALLSWLPGGYESKLGVFLSKIIEPFEEKLRFFTIGGVDFSPVFALIIMQALKIVIDSLLWRF